MNLEDLIEQQQAKRAGVSIETLRRRRRWEALRCWLSADNVLWALFVGLLITWAGIQCWVAYLKYLMVVAA